MDRRDDAERVHVETAAAWREWLAANHDRSDGVWLVFRRGSTVAIDGAPAQSYEEAVIEALAFGWIDGLNRPLDDERTMLWFTRRSPRSAWAATNKARVETLEREGRMHAAGRRIIDEAKANGMWTVLDGPSRYEVPDDLALALAEAEVRASWDAVTPSSRKAALSEIALAARAETRERRIRSIVDKLQRGEAIAR